MNTLLCIEQAPEQLNLDTLNNKTPIRGKLSFYWSSECGPCDSIRWYQALAALTPELGRLKPDTTGPELGRLKPDTVDPR